MDIPDELTLEIFNKASLEDLVNLCNSSAYYRGICNQRFWEDKFRQNQTFLLHPQSNPRDWANELSHSIVSMERARTIFADFKAGRLPAPMRGDPLGHDTILIHFSNIQNVDIFPDFLDKRRINSLLLYSRVRHDEEHLGGTIALTNPSNPTILFETFTELGQPREYRQTLTDEQTLYLLFIFTYYIIKLIDAAGVQMYDIYTYNE